MIENEQGDPTRSQIKNDEGEIDTSDSPEENLPKTGFWFTCRNPKDIRVCCADMNRYWTQQGNFRFNWVEDCRLGE